MDCQAIVNVYFYQYQWCKSDWNSGKAGVGPEGLVGGEKCGLVRVPFPLEEGSGNGLGLRNNDLFHFK